MQYAREERNGRDFGYRFLWRLLLLAGFATLNAAFFPGGDVLLLYQTLGTVFDMWHKLAFTLVLVASFVLLYRFGRVRGCGFALVPLRQDESYELCFPVGHRRFVVLPLGAVSGSPLWRSPQSAHRIRRIRLAAVLLQMVAQDTQAGSA